MTSWRALSGLRRSPVGAVRTAACFWISLNQRDAETIKRKLPSMYHQFKQLGDLDITTQPMEVGPTCHYIMGGVRVDADTAATCVPGLYAAGEVAAGLHGSNRLGGNSLSDLLVFGQRAGAAAAEYARRLLKIPDIDPQEVEVAAQYLVAPFEQGGTENPYAVMQDIQQCMEDHAGIVRTKEELERGLVVLEGLKQRAGQRQGVRLASLQSWLALRHRPARHARGLRGDYPLGSQPRGEPWWTHPAGFSRDGRCLGKRQHRGASAA